MAKLASTEIFGELKVTGKSKFLDAITSSEGILDIGDNSSRDEVLRITSQNHAGVYVRGDSANITGEPGGAFVAMALDGTDYDNINNTAAFLSAINTAGTDGMGGSLSGSIGNSVALGAKRNYPLHLVTKNAIRATVAANGNVGIGTTAPSDPLHVVGNMRFTGTLQAGTVPWARISGAPATATTHPTWAQVTGKPSTFTPSSHNHSATEITSGTLPVARGGTGNTTGTASAVAWANISGRPSTFAPSSHTHSYLPLSGGSLTNRLNINFLSGTAMTGQNAYGGLHFNQSGSNDYFTGITTSATTSGTQGGILFQGSGSYGTKIHFLTTSSYASGMQQRMIITQTGNVGIGTTSPSYPLHVVGNVGFSGTLQAGTVPWARISGAPATATAHPTWAQVTGKPSTFTPSTHTHSNITITAGNGLSGGGALSANRTITLGTPGTITNSTTNSVTATSHTHNITGFEPTLAANRKRQIFVQSGTPSGAATGDIWIQIRSER